MSLPVRKDCPCYPALSALLGGDAGRVVLVVRVFYHSVGHDLRQMELAAASGYWVHVRQLAHRVASACRHVGEDAVADAFAAIERAPCDSVCGNTLAQLFESARRDLIPVLDRAAGYAGIDVAYPTVCAWT